MTGEVLRYAAFTDAGSGGNPAGVVLDAGSLDDSEMLAIAREVGYSETAFVLPTGTVGTIRVPYFSPLAEVAFCGQLMGQEQWTTVHMFWAEGDGVFHVRNAFPPGGVVEDPATGAAAAAFGGYLRALGLVALPARVTLLQGRDMGAPSRLDVDADTVRVTGSATRLTPASG
jgi:predicted PhzF superfamily epimerase YddE/YHI9